MTEAAVAAVAEYLYAYEVTASFASAWAAAETIVAVAATVASVYHLREQQRKQQNAATAQYNASLKDRYIMVRSATEPRSVVLGRQRVSGPVAYIGSYGTDRQSLVFDVLLAAHEVDAIEAIYFDDEQVELDGSGNVVAVNRRDQFTLAAAGDTFTLTSEPAAATVAAVVDYGTTRVTLGVSVSGSAVTVSGGTIGQTGTVTISYQPASSPWITETSADQATEITIDGSGNGSVTLAATPVAGSVSVIWFEGGPEGSTNNITAYASVSGAVVTVAGSPFVSGSGATASVNWRLDTSTPRARVRKYLGAAGQAADPGMVAALPGVWTGDHTMTGIAHLVIEADYDPDAFPGGIPNVSAVVRGAKLYDPRTGLTVWSENPALMCRYVALSPLLGRQASATVNDAAVIVAANVCDTSTDYVVQGQTYTRPLYTAGTVVKSGTRAKDALDDLTRAMAGRWLFAGGQLVVKAGAYVTPLLSLDETWLSGASAVQVQPRPARSDVFNVLTGRFVDEQRDYMEIDYPRVESSAYITEDGAELPQDLPLNAVGFVGQAQQVAAVMMRDARQGLRVTLTCNMRAWPVEVFDTLNVTLPRFGWVNKVFEVMATGWTLDGGIQLTLKETDATIYAVGTSFSAADPAPNTLFPSPFKIQAVTSLACTSGNAQMLLQSDGTWTTRIRVDWDEITDPLVLADGGVEIRYGPSGSADSTWRSEFALRGQARTYLTADVREGTGYVVKARAFNALVKAPWSLPVTHIAVGKTDPAAAVTGLTGTITAGQITWTWAPCPDLDYGHTEIRSSDANWGSTASPPLWRGAGTRYVEVTTATGGVTRYARHVDTSGNPSTATATASVTVGAADVLGALVPEVYSSTPGSAVTVTELKTTPDAYARNTVLASVTFTPLADGVASAFAEGRVSYVNSVASIASAQYSLQDAAATYDSWKEQNVDVPASATVLESIGTTRRFTVTGGVAYTIGFIAAKVSAGDTMTVDNIELRVEVFKS